ncbi:MAG: gliding motility-associated C-terminal domain-containing protein [Saprospiraceae bacterium]|nr:gliding motility-associated C-terminal domain-containing protein [Saprospiraceae bacterium]
MQRHLYLLSILFFFRELPAQNIQIDYSSPTSFFVCDTAVFTLSLSNNSAVASGAINTTINLPPGVDYVPGSVTGAAENGGASNAPVFSIPGLAAGGSQSLTFVARASCDLVAAINAGQQFANTIGVSWPGGSSSVTTAPYPIETPLLLIVSSTNTNTFAQLGQQVVRTFTIRNTRLGALSGFTFQDSYPDGGFTVSADVGTVTANTGTLFILQLGPADFQQIGDGDALFELGEEIIVTETLTITECGIDLNQSLSTLNASWSCDGEVCQNSNSMATVHFLQSGGKPKLKFKGVVNVQEDLCGELPTRQHVTITNVGDQPAIGSWYCLFMLEGDGGPDIPWAGIDTTTLGVDSAGVWKRLYAYSAIPATLWDCPGEGPFYSNVCFNVPWIGPGDSVVVGFDLYACSAECPSDFAGWQIDYWLPKNCPPGEVENGYGIGPAPYVIDVLDDPEWQICLKEPMQDDQEYAILYSLSSLLLSDSQGVVRVSFRLPCGMSWGTQPFTLNGISPVGTGVYPDADTTVHWFEFPTPIGQSFAVGQFSVVWDCDQPCADRESECLHYFDGPGDCPMPCDADPDSLPRTGLRVISEFLLHPLVAPGCGIKQCLEYDLVYDCSGDSCLTPVSGWVEHQSGILRSSWGLPDNDGDRIADAGGTLDFNKIRLDRFMPGDTAETLLQGVVRGSQPGLSFENGLLRLYFDAYESDIDIDTGTLFPPCGYFDNHLIAPLSAVLRLRDAETGQVYTCTLGEPEKDCYDRQIVTINVNSLLCADTINNMSGLSWTWDISPAALAAAGCAVPAGFVFTDGDSIALRVVSRFLNPLPTDLHLNIRAGTFASVFNGYEPATDNYAAPPQDFSCSCPYDLIQYTPVQVFLNRSKYYLPPCEPSVSPMQEDFTVRLAFGDFFPFEYRPIVRVRQMNDLVPTPVVLTNTFLDSLELQDGPVILQDVPLGSSVDGELFATPLTELPEVDEGFTLHFNQTYEASCNLNLIKPLDVGVLFNWLPPLPFGEEGIVDTIFSYDPIKEDTFAFIPIRPALTAFSPQPNLIGTGNESFWEFTLLAVGDPVTAPNGWVYPQSNSGLLTDFQLLELPGLTPVPAVNGIFQIGEVPSGDVRQYRLVARNNSCGEEILLLFYGWNCDTLTVANDFACQRKNIVLKVQAQPAELEIDIVSPAGTAALCDTTDYHVVEVFNALYGAAYNPRLGFQLPPYLDLAPGSCQIAFPTGANWQSLPDPQPQPNGWLGWDLADWNAALAQDGLAGFPFAPDHSLSVRFRTLSNCGFVSGDKILYRTSAEQTCGDTTNLLVKPGDPIALDGVPPPYQAALSIGSGAPPPVLCGMPAPMQVQFSADAATGASDSIFVLLPPGATYVAGSYQPGANAPTEAPFIQNINNQVVLQWRLLPGMPAGSAVGMGFKVQNLGAAGCVPDTFRVWSTQQQSAVCVADGSLCSFSTQTGEASYTLQIAHPELSLNAFNATLENNTASFTISLTNTGTVNIEDPYILHFYRDNDGNGVLSAGDVLLETASSQANTAPGQTVTLTGALSIELADLCRLIVSPELSALCLCDTLSLGLDSLGISLAPLAICSGEAVSLGVGPQPSHQYAWSPANGLSCTDCADPVLQGIYNPNPQTQVLTYQLTESSGACVATGVQEISIYPMLHALNADTSICAGQAVLIEATPAWLYHWTGPGIQDPSLPSQLVAPEQTAVYMVDITDANNCTGVDMVLVTVLPTPEFDFDQDTLGVCGAEQLPLDGPEGPDLTYEWSPAGAVSNPSIADPVFTGQQNTLLILTVTNAEQCVASDSIWVGFSNNPVIELSVTALANCIGDTATVSLTGAETYQWSPASGVICLSGDCSEVWLAPLQTTVYEVIGVNVFGCADTAALTVTVPGAVQNTAETLVTCIGEPVAVFDVATDAPGLYCRTFSAASGCDSTHCITLVANDTLYAELLRALCPGATVSVGGVNYTQPGRYCQTFLTQQGCDSTICVVVDAVTSPAVDTFVRIVIGPGETPVLSLPGGFAGYAWSPTEYLSCGDCPAPVFTPPVPAPDSLTYTVTVTNAAGCSVVVTYRIRMLPPCDPAKIRIPDAFSPDGDGTNDVFRPIKQEGLEVILGLEIYNRWGQKVYAGNGSDAGWDGRIDGKAAAVDTYIYVLEVVCDGEKEKRVGELNLLR